MATPEQLFAIRKCVTSATRDAPSALSVFQVLLAELAIVEAELEALIAINLAPSRDQLANLLKLVNELQACFYEGITDPAAKIH